MGVMGINFGSFKRANSQGLRDGLRNVSFGNSTTAVSKLNCEECVDKFVPSQKKEESEDKTQKTLDLACRIIAKQQEIIEELSSKK